MKFLLFFSKIFDVNYMKKVNMMVLKKFVIKRSDTRTIINTIWD